MEDDNNLDEEQQELEEQEELEQQELEQEQSKANEKAEIKAQLNNLLVKTKLKFFPVFTPKEKALLNRAKKNGGFASKIRQIQQIMEAKKNGFAAKLKITGIVLLVVALVAIVVIVPVVVAAGFDSLFPFANGGKEEMNSENGASGEHFYGGRFVYADENMARNEILTDYVAKLNESITAVQTLNINKSETDFAVTVSVNITIPENLNFETFDEETFKAENEIIYSYLLSMAKLAFGADNSDAEIPQTLVEIVDNIKYFGLPSVDENGNGISDFAETIVATILTNSTFTCPTDTENILTQADIETAISDKLALTITAETRTEKLFIQDVKFTKSSDMLKGVKSRTYLAFIYFAKTDLTAKDMTFAVRTTDESFNAVLKNFNTGDEISLNKTVEESFENVFYYSTGSTAFEGNANIAIPASSMPTEPDLTQAKAISKLMEFKDELLVESDGILTWKPQGFGLSFSTTSPFIFNDDITLK